jgi:molybdenum cofactor biosynthesis enzyme MoaA
MRGYLRIDIANNCNIRCIMCQGYNGLAKADISFLDFDVFA